MVGLAGAALFGFFFALTYHTPTWVEDFARDYLQAQVAKHVDITIDGLGPPPGSDALSHFAAQVYEDNEARIAELKELLKREAREKLIDCIDAARQLDAAQRETISGWIEKGATSTIGLLTLDKSRLVTLIQSGYLKILGELKREIRGFAIINALAFLLLVLVSFLKPDEVHALFIPGVLLAASTLFCAYVYVFDQNWLLAMIQGNYVGKIYALYLGLVFLWLCDIALNRGRVTRVLARSAVGI